MSSAEPYSRQKPPPPGKLAFDYRRTWRVTLKTPLPEWGGTCRIFDNVRATFDANLGMLFLFPDPVATADSTGVFATPISNLLAIEQV